VKPGRRSLRLCLLAVLLLLGALAAALPAHALQLSAAATRVSLEGRLAHFADPTGRLPFEAVSQPDFTREKFTRLPDARSLGYDTAAHWFHAELTPAADAPQRWVLAIGTPELEEVDVWVQLPDGSYKPYVMGYHRPYENRPLRTRLFALPMEVFSGMHLYLRVRTTNAINVHVNLWQVEAFTAGETRSNFYRGMYFGILLIAAALHAILGLRLRDVVMAAYAGYVAAQVLFNLGTNGYLPVLLTVHTAWFTDALPRIGWLGGAAAIVLMWDRLLQFKEHWPRVHRLFMGTLVLNLCLLPFALLPFLVNEWVLWVVKLANALNSLNFFLSMGLLIHTWRQQRRGELLVYFVAFVIPALGTTINSAANLGLMAQNTLAADFYQIAPLVHVLVMSYGLALRLRQLQYDKTAAQHAAAMATQRSEEQRRFVAMLSHEFGNPLAAIDRAAQMLQLKLPGLPPAQAQRLALIRGNAATLARFVEHFLMTEALEHGALKLSRKPCRLRPLLEDTIRQQGEAAAPRLRLLACPDGVFALDATLLSAALGNLLANALRYSPPGSAVEISAAHGADGLRIRVTDHGQGMTPDDLEKLGTPYFRGPASLGKKGSGLGYHFTRCIVQAHGGQLTARSSPGTGLEVEIVLPA